MMETRYEVLVEEEDSPMLFGVAGGEGLEARRLTSDRAEAELREVTLGDLYGSDMVMVTRGLVPGETVVTAGVYRIEQGERVKILK